MCAKSSSASRNTSRAGPSDHPAVAVRSARGAHRPIVALLTDFGTSDHYVASMKGVVLGICPSATLVDITHEVPAQDVVAGAVILESCWRDFPAGTVFLGVVDPGVGTERRALAAEAGGRRFVGPDNGLFSLAWRQARAVHAVEVRVGRYQRRATSRTFEGRDRFAPAAAHLARGLPLTSLGPPIGEVARISLPEVSTTSRRLTAEVVAVDHFGNLITNLRDSELARWAGADGVAITVGRHRIRGLARTYAEAPPAAACALIGSSGRLEVAIGAGSAADALGARCGTRVVVIRTARPA